MKISRVYSFDAAHRLPMAPPGHKCGRLHGHTYSVEVGIEGCLGEKTGFVVDFFDVDRAISPIIERLDHYYLNEIRGLENPTSENIAAWIGLHAVDALPLVVDVTVCESPRSSARWVRR